jgi:hypothetical protein
MEKENMSIDFDEGPAPVTNAEITEISRLAELQLQLEREVQAQEDALKVTKEKLRGVQEKDLPEAMASAGMKEFKLLNGAKVSIKEDISASLSGEKKTAAIAWLTEHGYQDIVSCDVTVGFRKGEEERARTVARDLVDKGFVPKLDQNVNTATLKSLIRELMEQGIEVPLETLGAYQWKKAIVKA